MNEEAILIYYHVLDEKQAFKKREPVKTSVFASELSVNRNEFYMANQTGMKPKIVLEVWDIDFELTAHSVDDKKAYATHVEYHEEIYKILRTYKKKNSDKLELVLE